jgi:PiT family inorganic phosphate transporter
LTGAIIWGVATRLLGFPSSSSHALIGGLIGAVLVSVGWQQIRLNGLIKVLISLFAAPLIGFMVGYFFLRLVDLLCWNATPGINWFFKKSQTITGLVLALSHGANDAQKSMGIITLALLAAGTIKVFEVKLWVIAACSGTIAMGTLLGGWRLIRTVGSKFYRIRPVHGFTAQLASSAVIIGSSLLGGPVSTTQVISSAIMGVGASERITKVHWQVAQDIAVSWLLTIPVTALLAAGAYLLISIFL